jgi:hypothetical protein
MPTEITEEEIPPALPEWATWDDTTLSDWVSENVQLCNCCDDVHLFRNASTPSWAEMDSGRWVRPILSDSYADDDVRIRERWLRDQIFSYTTDYVADISYDNLGESYDWICYECHNDRSSSNSDADEDDEDSIDEVHDYGYRPRPVFYSWIAEQIGQSRHPQLAPAGVSGVVEPFAYMKWDGSVGGGFELVTHPHTLEAYQNRTVLWDALNHLRHHGWRSWGSSSSCGLHIHINNASFVNVGHGMRFLKFIFDNREPLIRFAGRDSSYSRFDYNQFVQRQVHTGWDDNGNAIMQQQSVADVVKRKQVNDHRYLAVNVQNENTYELRFFKGNMNPKVVLACLEFVHALHSYTETLTSHDCLVNRALGWRPFLAYIRRESMASNFKYRNLYDRLTQSRRNGDYGFLNASGNNE